MNKKPGRGKQSFIQWLPNFVLYLGIASVAQGESSGFVNRRSSVRIRPLAVSESGSIADILPTS